MDWQRQFDAMPDMIDYSRFETTEDAEGFSVLLGGSYLVITYLACAEWADGSATLVVCGQVHETTEGRTHEPDGYFRIVPWAADMDLLLHELREALPFDDVVRHPQAVLTLQEAPHALAI